MNVKELARDVGLEEAEFIELAEIFVETSVSDLNRLENALNTKDAHGASLAAHSIKGAAVNLGMNDVFDLAKRIELQACQNCFDESKEAVGAIKGKIGSIAKALKAKRPIEG